MDSSKLQDQKVDINFESHPPIEDDLNGVATLLKQTLLQFVDCNSLAKYLIDQKDLTQIIAQEAPSEDNEDDDEPDDDIYGVTSVIELPLDDVKDDQISWDSRRDLSVFIQNRCLDFKKIMESSQDAKTTLKIGMVVNERYMNLPPQLSLPTLKTLTSSMNDTGYTHLVFITKILVRSKSTNTRLPSKKMKSSSSSAQQTEPIIFVNPEEEIIYEQSDNHTDIDVSAYCDENATWSFSSDIKYIPHRRILTMDIKNWPKTLKCLEKELN